MSSHRQLEANRRNSQLSTGPRTPEGKAASRFNALKSGINCQKQIIPGEDPAELEAMTAGYHRDWAPATYLERFLVDSLVRADWQIQRLSRLEAELWTHEMESARKSMFSKLDENAPMGDTYGRTYDRFARLQRRIDSAERSYYRALTQLQRVRSQGDEDPGGPFEPDLLPSDPQPTDPLPDPVLSSGRPDPSAPEEPMPTQQPAAKLASFCTPAHPAATRRPTRLGNHRKLATGYRQSAYGDRSRRGAASRSELPGSSRFAPARPQPSSQAAFLLR